MIDYSRSTFTWKAHPIKADPYYKYSGGIVGTPGQVYHVRFNLQASFAIDDESGNRRGEVFLGSPCRSEYTIASSNLFQIPSGEWRMAFSREYNMPVTARPSWEPEPEMKPNRLDEQYTDFNIDIRNHAKVEELTDAGQIVDATLASDLLGARSTYTDSETGLSVSVEFPVNLINLNAADGEFQICTGPVLLPDLKTWDGSQVSRAFLAQVALTSYDHVEFILRREIDASESDQEWLDKPRGRDRYELIDPNNAPPREFARKRPTVYNETWELDAVNVVWRVQNS